MSDCNELSVLCMIEKIDSTIQENSLVHEKEKILVAFSGGKDSACLLDVMLRLKERYSIEIFVFHMDHCTRNGASHDEALFAAGECERLGIDLFMTVHAVEDGPSFEERARELRYAAMQKAAAHLGCSRIATAHTRDDNIETALMRIFGGTSVYGLRAIPLRRGPFIRPLLNIRSSEVVEYCESMKIKFVTDQSNNDTKYLRNRIRHQLLPQLLEMFSAPEDALAGLIAHSIDVCSYIDTVMTMPTVMQWGGGYVIASSSLAGSRFEFMSIMSRLIRNYIKINVTYGMLNDIYNKFQNKRKRYFTLYTSSEMVIVHTFLDDKDCLFAGKALPESNIEYPPFAFEISADRCLTFEANGCIITVRPDPENEKDDKNCCRLYLEDLSDSVVVSSRMPGDAIVCGGMRRRIKKILINEKLSTEEKQQAIVVRYREQVMALLLHHLGRRDYIGDTGGDMSAGKKVLAIHCLKNMSDRLTIADNRTTD